VIRDEIETVESTPNLGVEDTEQLKLIFPQIFGEGKLILIQLK
jgi:hypothetical protein